MASHYSGLFLISFIAKRENPIVVKQLGTARFKFFAQIMTISDHSSSNNVDKVFDKANICLNYCNKERPLIEYAGGGGFRRK